MYLESFTLPIEREERLIELRMGENGDYIDNVYPCSLFGLKELDRLLFQKVAVFYGGNGPGKSTLLNLIAAKLKPNRIAPFNGSELFDAYAESCTYELGEDDEGSPYQGTCPSILAASRDGRVYFL